MRAKRFARLIVGLPVTREALPYRLFRTRNLLVFQFSNTTSAIEVVSSSTVTSFTLNASHTWRS